jgi:Holliday junction resolvasome RuvABC endonuclease subunit
MPRSSSRATASVDPDILIRVGIDASHKRTGWAIAVGARIVHYGTHLVDLDAPIHNRRAYWKDLRDTLRQMERHERLDVHAIGIEAPWLGPNRQGSIQHARVIGMHEALATASFPYASLSLIQPQTWRSACGLPRSGKEPAMRYAEAALRGSGHGADAEVDQDAADAICIVRTLYLKDQQENAET